MIIMMMSSIYVVPIDVDDAGNAVVTNEHTVAGGNPSKCFH